MILSRAAGCWPRSPQGDVGVRATFLSVPPPSRVNGTILKSGVPFSMGEWTEDVAAGSAYNSCAGHDRMTELLRARYRRVNQV